MKAIIAGAGIGGLTAALCLHRIGFEVEIYESARTLRPLGVGINLLPHGAAILHGLGLGRQLDAIGIATRAIEYRTRYGHLIASDSRGVEAGFAFPQYSIHRGYLQTILLEAARDRLGGDVVKTGLPLTGFSQGHESVRAHFDGVYAGRGVDAIEGDILIGGDGFHSAVRRQLHPDEGPAHFEGTMLWRGANEQSPFGDGRTMFIAGNHDAKIVCYPISERARRSGTALFNWVAEVRNCGPRAAADADWTKTGAREFIEHFNEFQMPDIDLQTLFGNTQVINEYPMIDRDPLQWWSDGRVTLLGDAAHPMFPIGANGASQAILDGKALADSLERITDPAAALLDYEGKRRDTTGQVVLANRAYGPEQVLDIADQRMTGPNDRIEDLITAEEIEAVARNYRSVAGFRKTSES